MTTRMTRERGLTGWVVGLGMFLALLTASRALAGDVHFDVLHFGTETLTNATVTGKSKTDVYVMHSQGLVNVKIRDLDAPTLYKLGLGPKPDNYQEDKPKQAGVLVVAAKTPVSQNETSPIPAFAAAVQAREFPSLKFPAAILGGLAVAGVAVFLFFSYCLKLIVEKSGREAGALVWIPVVQLIPMVQAAGMSGWWALGFCVPGLNVVAHILWAIKIVKARQKSAWVMIALLLPVFNLAGFIYLAFSRVENGADEDGYMRGVLTPFPQQA